MKSSALEALDLLDRTSFEEISCYYVCEGSLDQIVTTNCSLLRAKATHQRGFLVYLKESVTNFKTNVPFSKTTCGLLFYLVNNYNPRAYLHFLTSCMFRFMFLCTSVKSHCLCFTTLKCDTPNCVCVCQCVKCS